MSAGVTDTNFRKETTENLEVCQAFYGSTAPIAF
jgi:hypothetical protein